MYIGNEELRTLLLQLCCHWQSESTPHIWLAPPYGEDKEQMHFVSLCISFSKHALLKSSQSSLLLCRGSSSNPANLVKI